MESIDDDDDGYIISENLADLLVSLDRPLRPLGVPHKDTKDAVVKARKRLKQLNDEGTLPNLGNGIYMEYKAVLGALITLTFNEYNNNHADAPIHQVHLDEEKMSMWEYIKKRRRASWHTAAEGVGVVRAGKLATILSESGQLGKGSHTMQLKSLTELVKIQSAKMDVMEDEIEALSAFMFAAGSDSGIDTMLKVLDRLAPNVRLLLLERMRARGYEVPDKNESSNGDESIVGDESFGSCAHSSPSHGPSSPRRAESLGSTSSSHTTMLERVKAIAARKTSEAQMTQPVPAAASPSAEHRRFGAPQGLPAAQTLPAPSRLTDTTNRSVEVPESPESTVGTLPGLHAH